jgi:hypothetical protein
VLRDFDTPLVMVGMGAPSAGAPVELVASVESMHSMHTGLVRRWDFLSRKTAERVAKYRARGFVMAEAIGRRLRYEKETSFRYDVRRDNTWRFKARAWKGLDTDLIKTVQDPMEKKPDIFSILQGKGASKAGSSR